LLGAEAQEPLGDIDIRRNPKGETTMRHTYLVYGGLVVLIGFPLGAGGGVRAPALAVADSQSAESSSQSMKGEVIMLGGEVCVVRDAVGKSVLFKIDKGTTIDGSVKEGKRVEVSASADGRAISIRETS
jgi:hypothetical protein